MNVESEWKTHGRGRKQMKHEEKKKKSKFKTFTRKVKKKTGEATKCFKVRKNIPYQVGNV